MAPIKSHHSILSNFTLKNRISTRSSSIVQCPNKEMTVSVKDMNRPKRKADCSPSKENKLNKRTAFGERNINTELIKTKTAEVKPKKTTVPVKKVTTHLKILPSIKTVHKPKQNENLFPPAAPGQKISTRQSKTVIPNQTAVKPKEVLKENNANVNKPGKRLSNEFEKTEDTLYCTALEDGDSSNESTYFSAKKLHNLRSARTSESAETQKSNKENEKMEAEDKSNLTVVAEQMELKLNLGDHDVPENVINYDEENWNDIFQVSHYAMDIFNYLKEREVLFPVPDYLDRQICLTRWMRSLLVDWMVEIQESFELNHETLYLGVKLVDMYLSKMTVGKETLQLVGAAAMLIASKYDERIPPMLDDFLYICDGAYTKRELIRMEINLFKVIGFDLGIPISYRFLRRYARCAKITMPVLTLARFILEYSLMNYETVTIRDSKLASAALYIALRMQRISHWTPTLEFYTGYKLEEFKDVVIILNTGINQPPKSQIMTVRNKYSHKIFFEVAKVPLLGNNQLF
ncbi:G2/mitotic-specific cyclin-B3 isoform X1 [Diabrotica virgifera virgifera]|uniref:G2/mitotic-specific cyclin-B3 isoform X1 n=1 Tax=Diabrotica virgifera virgifera TaxID=50390 RepID=A0A6P7FKN4_DIAVI|nr:G2/mitotic-specific cyclin-B3 isoform X1 [Diabrotica virgifera virgifera]XP_028136566.1 G2/mitotic-specific cyclin-B3 isoform X1 [Diabrotica virgifera virgifera]XP_028136567.1 G2/mitotic-specific cyclin-B3 isoform X1 [Diabrotica virgifera virgifera]XP_028136568.1 G2/mitotic-specific cyclin-B3 isoform X1 [Diabrotica virgifera virgifera]XP_050505151.1 G2/mitotic-specific cyclin-B3 isoform X1 [Diabrotica virgifera virgifera]